jgi:predicted PurR-regulated permease PerM
VLDRLSRGKRNLVLLVLAILVAWFSWTIRGVLNPLLLGYLVAYILHPLVLRVQSWGLSRRAAVNLIFATGLVLTVLMTIGLSLQMRALALEFYESAMPADPALAAEAGPTFSQRLQGRLDEFTAKLNEWGLDVGPLRVPEAEDLRQWAGTYLQEHAKSVQAAAGAGLASFIGFLARFLGGVLSVVGFFLLVPLYGYFFLFELDRLHSFVRRHLPKRDRAHISRVAGRIGEVIASFFRGRLSVSFLKGILLSLGFAVAGVPYALLFGMLSGMMSIIPFFGAFLGFTLAFTFGTLEHGVVGSLVRTGSVCVTAELIEGYVLIPKILGNKLGLHPLVVLFALFAGGAAMGMLGVLIALPLTATIVILVVEFVLPALRQFADEDRGAAL